MSVSPGCLRSVARDWIGWRLLLTSLRHVDAVLVWLGRALRLSIPALVDVVSRSLRPTLLEPFELGGIGLLEREDDPIALAYNPWCDLGLSLFVDHRGRLLNSIVTAVSTSRIRGDAIMPSVVWTCRLAV